MMRSALGSELTSLVYAGFIVFQATLGRDCTGQPSSTLATLPGQLQVQHMGFLGCQHAGNQHTSYRSWVPCGHQRIPTDSNRIAWLQVAAASRDMAWLGGGVPPSSLPPAYLSQWLPGKFLAFLPGLSQAFIPGRADTFLKYQSVLLARVNSAGEKCSS